MVEAIDCTSVDHATICPAYELGPIFYTSMNYISTSDRDVLQMVLQIDDQKYVGSALRMIITHVSANSHRE